MHFWWGKAVQAVERIADPRDADARVLVHLGARGDAPSTPRESTHYLLLPARAAAEAVAEELTGDGWLTAVKQSDDAWLVVSTRVRALTPELVRETRTRFETLAGEHGGLYDGWEART